MASQRQLADDIFLEIFMDLVEQYGLSSDQQNKAFDRFVKRLKVLRQFNNLDCARELIVGMVLRIAWETKGGIETSFIPEEEEDQDDVIIIRYPGCTIEIPMQCWSDELRLDIDDVLDQHYRMVEAVLLKYGIILEATENYLAGENIEEKMKGAIDQIDIDEPEDTDSQSS